jgi:HD-GYP domain-containing protein (c-di-GMP phosphodiesterase class II)/DNA-binding LacI/PurR family transcriptional regulator
MLNRNTIGFLVDFFVDDYQAEILNGVKKEAEKLDINLICYCGGPLNSPESHHWPRNAVYDLVNRKTLNGLIIMGASIGNFIDIESLKNFYERFSYLPLVSIGVDVGMADVPSLLIDNAIGMKKSVEHLITDHGFTRIAFICGTESNNDANLRFNAYKEVLESHNIPLDPDLICPGNFYSGAGKNAVRILIDERKAEFDALIGSNDLMTLEAMREFQLRGIRIPYDIAVVGFDDVEESRYISPPLTTVRQPLFTIGQESVRIVMNLINGEKVPQVRYYPTELIIRTSCGCNPHQNRFRINKETDSLATLVFPKQKRGELCAFIERTIMSPHSLNASRYWAEALSVSLIEAAEQGDIDIFIMEFNSFIIHLRSEGHEILDWSFPLRAIIDRFYSNFDLHVNNPFFDILAGRVSQTFNEHKMDQLFMQKKQSNKFSRSLHFASIELTTTFSLAKIKESIQTMLPDLGIERFHLVRYVKDKQDALWIYLSYNNGNIVELSHRESVRDKNDLFATIYGNEDKRFSIVVLALYFKNEQIGYVIYDLVPISGLIYENLAIQLSSTLMGAQLISDVEETQREVLYTLGDILERRSFETGSHVKRVAEYSYVLAVKYGLNEEDAQLLKHASPMHDIGKLGIEESILRKPGKLTPEEFEKIKTHTTLGYEILKSSERKLLKVASIIASQHHERYDGSGYPRGLKGEDIHIFGRITCIADVFDALGSDRVYKSEWPMDEICEYIQSQKGKMFDPKLTDIFFECLQDILVIRASF